MKRTTMQRTNADGFPKAAEVIEITGASELEAVDRAALNILYQNAHDSGRLSDPDAEFEIELARLRPSKHESNDPVRSGLRRSATYRRPKPKSASTRKSTSSPLVA